MSAATLRRYDVYRGGFHICTLDKTLRVVSAPVESGATTQAHNRFLNALQYYIDQQPTGLLILPDGAHKSGDQLTLPELAPDLVNSCRRRVTKKNPLHSYRPDIQALAVKAAAKGKKPESKGRVPGTEIGEIRPFKNNKLRPQHRRNSAKQEPLEMAL